MDFELLPYKEIALFFAVVTLIAAGSFVLWPNLLKKANDLLNKSVSIDKLNEVLNKSWVVDDQLMKTRMIIGYLSIAAALALTFVYLRS